MSYWRSLPSPKPFFAINLSCSPRMCRALRASLFLRAPQAHRLSQFSCRRLRPPLLRHFSFRSPLGPSWSWVIMIISPFLISQFDRVQTTLFEDLNFPAIESAENDRSHTNFSFRICWWGSWALVTSEVPRHMNDDSGNSGIARIQEPWQVQFLVARRISGSFEIPRIPLYRPCRPCTIV